MGGGTVTTARRLTVRDPRVATGVPDAIAKADPAPAEASAPPGGFRPDIQGLRALAVALVVVYHLYPTLLPGGFAGVDIFFVISGFLITGHLWREYRKAGMVSLVDFWGRRARRLMPAAAVVLAVTWAGSLLLLPRAQLEDAAAQVRASALYFQNWQLAHDAVDYLKSTEAASPVQHFWSLSVEEQFYLFWPLLFIAAVPVSRLASGRARPGGRHRATRAAPGVPQVAAQAFIGCLTMALVLASLAYSGYETKVNPSAAYFVTTTRIWELGAGGLLALLSARLAEKLGRLGWLAWVGLAMAVSSAFVLHGTTAFPGLIALLPVTGAALVIACGRGRGGIARLMSLRPLVFIGGISYSLYLWHWPVFTLWASWRGHKIGAVDGPLLVLLSVLLAWLTKVAVEDRVREARLLARHRWRSLSTALAVVLPVALVSGYLITKAPEWGGNLGPGYPGAAALAGTAGVVGHRPVLPPPDSTATTMEPEYWKQGCLVPQPSAVPKECAYGDTVNPRLTVVLAGDSIAGNWFPALDQIATQEHWELVTELHGNCMLTATMMFQSTTNSAFTACHQWGSAVMRDLLTTIHPDVVIASGRYADETYDHHDISPAARADIGAGMATDWKQLEQHGIPVVAIRETPELASGAPLCILHHPGDYASCARPVATATVRDSPIWYAARDMAASGAGAVPVIDMDDLICGPRTCDPVVGNVLVYFDTHHMTESYSQTLAPFLRTRLLAASPVLRAAA